MEKTLYSKTWRTGKNTMHNILYHNGCNETISQIDGYFFRDGKLSDARNVENFDYDWVIKEHEKLMKYCELYPPDTIVYQLNNSSAYVDKYNIVHTNLPDDCKYFPDMVCVHNNNYIIYKNGYISKANYINDFDKRFEQFTISFKAVEHTENYKREYYKYDGDRLGVIEYHKDKVFINDSVLLKILEKDNLPVYLKHIINPYRIVEDEILLKKRGDNEFKIISGQGTGIILYENSNGITANSLEVDNIIIISNPHLIKNIKSDKPIYYRDSTGKCRLYGSKEFNKDSKHLLS